MEQHESEKATVVLKYDHEQTRHHTEDGELISLDFVDPALAAKISLLNNVRFTPHFYRRASTNAHRLLMKSASLGITLDYSA